MCREVINRLKDIKEDSSIELKNKALKSEINKQKDKLEIRAKELEEIIFVASHDLRSPLVNLQGFSNELLYTAKDLNKLISQLDDGVEVKKELRDILENDLIISANYIKDNSLRLDRLINGIIKYSRLIRDEIDYNKVDVNDLVEKILREYKHQIEREEIRVEVAKLPPCLGESKYLKEVFKNLIDNAFKYLKQEENSLIKISAEEKDGKVIYSVYDNGMGIKKEYQDKIFDIFNRLAEDENNSEGLGLTLSKKIVEMHQGQLWVESEWGEFSCFYLSLPAYDK